MNEDFDYKRVEKVLETSAEVLENSKIKVDEIEKDLEHHKKIFERDQEEWERTRKIIDIVMICLTIWVAVVIVLVLIFLT